MHLCSLIQRDTIRFDCYMYIFRNDNKIYAHKEKTFFLKVYTFTNSELEYPKEVNNWKVLSYTAWTKAYITTYRRSEDAVGGWLITSLSMEIYHIIWVTNV